MNFKMAALSGRLLLLFVFITGALVFVTMKTVVRAQENAPLTVNVNFAGRVIQPDETITVTFNRELGQTEGRPAVIIGVADFTALFTQDGKNLEFTSGPVPLPPGESIVAVYLISPAGVWSLISEFQLVAAAGNSAASTEGDATETETKTRSFEFTPKVAINIKGQNQSLTFPRESQPERNPFTDVAGQGSLAVKVSRRGWNFSSQFDFAGTSFKPEALRFSELQNKAPRIDLSSYLVELSKGKFKLNMGHVSYGSNRHLINGFSSRGLSLTVPLGKKNDITFAAVNGTAIVGYDNLIGVTRRRHSLLGVTYGREFFEKRPNGLRIEFSVLRGSLLPLAAVNQGEINDAEKSFGFGFKVIGSDPKQRFRWEAGISRSRFTNPTDPLLEQNQTVTPIRETWRTARYLELSFDFIKDRKIWNDRTMKLTGTFRHEEIEPLFRSIGTSLQADRHQNQFEIVADVAGFAVTYGNLRDKDNLIGLPSILRTLNRRQNLIVAIPLTTFFDPAKPKKWLPQISYSYEFVHQFGASFPVEGEFRDPSQIPDQKSYVQAANLVWQFSETLSFNYSHNRAFQNNRQLGRENADFRSTVNSISLVSKPLKTLDLTVELSRERQRNIEQPRTDRSFRLGSRVLWQLPFLKNSTLSSGFSANLTGDTGNLTDARNAEFDSQWSYKFKLGTGELKKTEAEFFIRFANRYGDTFDRQSVTRNFTKAQVFNFGINFNFF